MKVPSLKKPACSLLLAIVTSVSVAAQNVETNFQTLTLGMKRESLVALFGPPNSEISSRTLTVPTERLKWIGPGGKTYVAQLVYGVLWRWRACSAGVAEC